MSNRDAETASTGGRADDPTASVDRRTFLRRSAGTLAALAVATAFRLDAQAQQAARERYLFLRRDEVELLEALASRIWPSDDEGAGAVEAGAVHYIDRALAGPYAGYQQAYRIVLHDLNELVRRRFGVGARGLAEEQIDLLIGELEDRDEDQDPLPGLPGRQLELGLGPSTTFDMIRRHVMEGVFCDPVHGGNRDFAGWRVVGYPGAHFVYSAEEQQVFEPLEKPYQSVGDL
jgi:hypothetical protein